VKTKTRAQVEAMKVKAVRFMVDVRDDPDRASEIEDESVESYAQRKQITIKNPRRGFIVMANKSAGELEMEESLDTVAELLEDALDPKLTREEVVQKVEEAYGLAAGEEGEVEEPGDNDE